MSGIEGGGAVRAKFSIGELVHHRLFDYRGVVIDVDPIFSASEQWYEQVARSRPPKDRPWYHVLVDGETHSTYVAEEFLMAVDEDEEGVDNPLVKDLFSKSCDGNLAIRAAMN